MTRPKYISILKMSIIHAIAYVVLTQLVGNILIIKFMDCFEIMNQVLNAGHDFSFDIHPECYDETQRNLVSWNSRNFHYPHFGIFFISILLTIVSTIHIGHKWYWFITSFITYMILVRLVNLLGDNTNFTYKILLSIFDNVALAVYSNIIIILSLSLFLYFGKPVINFIKNNRNTFPDKRLDNILDA